MSDTVAILLIYFVALVAILYIVMLGFRHGVPRPLMCSCRHGYGTHAVAGRCNAEIKRVQPTELGKLGPHPEYVPCPCLAYDGPKPRT